MNRHRRVSCSPTCSAMSATGWLFASSTTMASNRSADAAARPRPRHRHCPDAMRGARHARHSHVDERLVLEEVQVTPHALPHVMHRACLLTAPGLGAVEARARLEADRDMQFAFAVLPVAELHARHTPRAGQLQGGGEQRSGIHTTKLADRYHHTTGLTHTKQRKTI